MSVSSVNSAPQMQKPVKPTKPQQPKPEEARSVTAKDVLKLTGKTAGGAASGFGAVVVHDLFFHFGNNGGTSYKGGVYAAGAAAGAAIGGALGYRKYLKEQEARKAGE